MKLASRHWTAAALLLLLALPAAETMAATKIFKAASLALPMNSRMGSARSSVLGLGFTGIADDPAALLWNPAGLSLIKTGQVGLHHNSWIGEVTQETVLFALPMKKLGGFGVMVNYVNYGTFDGRTATGVPTRTLGASDLGYGIGWGRNLTDRVSAGFVFRRQQQTLADESYSNLSADLGMLVQLPWNLRFGASYNNFGTQLAESSSATAMRSGLAWQTAFNNGMKLLLGAGYSMEPNGTDRVNLAGEFKVNSLITMRAGYEHRLADDLIDGFTGATLGMGIAYRKIRLDYSYIPFGELGNSQRVSLVYMFDDQASSTPVPTPSPTAEVTAVVTPDPTPWPTATPEPIIQFQVPQSALKQAQNFEKEGRYREAVQAYNQAIQLNPQGIAAWRGLGMVYYRLGRHEFAIRCFEEVLRLNPSDTRLRDWLEKYKSSQPNSFIIRDLPFS